MKNKKFAFISALVVVGLLLLLLFIFPGQATLKEKQIKTWKMPIYMTENLQFMVNDFNKRFQEKILYFRTELKAKFSDFKDMPEDALYDLDTGVFVGAKDMEILQQKKREFQQRNAQQEIQQKLKQEAKDKKPQEEGKKK